MCSTTTWAVRIMVKHYLEMKLYKRAKCANRLELLLHRSTQDDLGLRTYVHTYNYVVNEQIMFKSLYNRT